MHATVNLDAENTRKARARRWLLRFPRGVPIAVLAILALATAASVALIETAEEQNEQSLMREVAQSVSASLARRGNTTESYLRAGSALFSTTPEVSLPLFRRFASELSFDSNLHGSEAIGWAEVVEDEKFDIFPGGSSAEETAEVRVWRNSDVVGNTVVPITFLRPELESTRAALGFDLYSEPIRRAAMDEATRRVRPIATAKIDLRSDRTGSGSGFLVFVPVFEGPIGSRKVKGFIFSPFDAQFYLTAVMEASAHPEMGARIYDGSVAAENLLANYEPEFASGKFRTEALEIGGRDIVIQVESARASSLSPLSMTTLLFGLALASLLLLLIRLLTRQALEDEASLAFLEEQSSIRNSLTRELNHRVKNTLASIISIISLTRGRADNLDEFADGLEGRVRALSATHDLLTQSEWGTTPVRSVIEVELAPYCGDDDAAILDGPAIELAPNDALSLGLAIHELATNAAKYGALSQPGGIVQVSWARDGDELIVVRWVESGGPKVEQDITPGFGTQLIQKIVAHELRHDVDLRFAPEGVTCTLRVPLRVRGAFQIRERLARLAN